MNTIAKIFLIAFGIGFSVMLFSSCSNPLLSIDETVLLDKTENGFLVKPDAETHAKIFEQRTDLWSGRRFRILNITDVAYNKFTEAFIPTECEWFARLPNRKKRNSEFIATVISSVNKTNEIPAGKTKSVVFFPMATELNRLAKSEAQRKILVAYTDLMENTSRISFYDKTILELLTTDPDSVKKVLQMDVSLPDLSGIEIFIVYEPRNAAESMDFQTVSAFFKTWFEGKNATVSIGGSLPFQQ